MICANLGGANNDKAIEQFGKDHKDWFKKLIPLPYGIPSHDTFNRMLGAIYPREMENLLLIAEKEPMLIAGSPIDEPVDSDDNEVLAALKRHICIDAKVLRALTSLNPLSLLGAFFPYKKITVAQEKVGYGTNEITTIPKILHKMKDWIKDKIITIDAIGTQVKNAKIIIDLGADYLLPVKGNQHQLYADVKLFLDDVANGKMPGVKYTYHETLDKGHGRLEKRTVWTTDSIRWLYRKHRWKGLQTLSIVQTTITKIRKGKLLKTTITKKYYISSLLVHAEVILAVARGHWAIENKKHWPLNVAFREHISTTHKGWGAENMGILRRLSLALIQNNSSDLSINNKRARIASNEEYMFEVLLGEKVDLRSHIKKMENFLDHGINMLINKAISVGLEFIH
jgi:predicted transposase YbfD/YdcC